MSVFNAIEHKIDESRSPSPASTPEKKFESAADTESPLPESEDDLLFADDPEVDAAESTYAGTRLTFTDDELSDSFRSVNEREKDGNFAPVDDDDSAESVDESWAEAMLSDVDEPKKAPDPEPEPPPEVPPEPSPAKEPQAPAEDDYDGFFIDEPEPGDQQQPELTASTSPYHDLRREPVGMAGGNNGRLRGFLWSLAILVLIGGLVSQVVWFQFDRLSAIPQLRPFYVQGCEMFGCELKPLVDVQSIQSRKLVVKTNAENRSQLIVDAVIINRAAFEQPFPAIALTFSNLNNDVVAQSVFTPDEYLAGDGQDLEAMPTDTPVRILINIRDPGKDAVNYNIAFQAYTP